MSTDDDLLTGPVPLPDAEPTAAERAHAKTFADIVDKTLAGHTPAAMSPDDRALLEVATVIRAACGDTDAMQLAPARQHALVEDALRQAMGDGQQGRRPAGPMLRDRGRRWVPWAVAGASALVAVAAVIALWLRAPRTVQLTAHAPRPASWMSRSADSLIGPIAREQAGDASLRIDSIFADRLDGFRERQLARRGKP